MSTSCAKCVRNFFGLPRAKTTTVETTALRSAPRKSYLPRGAPQRRAVRVGDLESAFCPCHAEMHNRMLNTRLQANSVSSSAIGAYSVEPFLVVEHTRYN